MNISTDPANESWHRLVDPGSYEWWYFDAEDPRQEVSVVLIWFSGFAFSPFYLRHYDQWRSRRRTDSPNPGQYAGFSFQLYERGREVVNFIKEGGDGQCLFDEEGVGACFERNSFRYDPEKDEYLVSIDFHFPARGLRVAGSFSFRPRHRFDYRHDNDCLPGLSHRHEWLLSVPKAGVEGGITIEGPVPGKRRHIAISGQGYHDHNLGSVPMHEYYRRWYWGRVLSDRFDLVYYVVFFRNRGCEPLTVMLLNDNRNGRKRIVEKARFSESGLRRGVFAPLHGRSLKLESDGLGLDVSHGNVLDSGPFYLRFSSKFTLSVDGAGVEVSNGISEFLDPSALNSPLMRFFTASRILRDGETTAMYRYYNFFRHQFDWLNRKKF